MLTLQVTGPTKIENLHYSVTLANTSREIEEAQHLRYRVFMQELGAGTRGVAQTQDVDAYDADCEHLIVRDEVSRAVVGCYRIMRPEIAKQRGAYYADSEFDLAALQHLRHETAEVGRACIDPAYRNGTVLMLLWSALGRYIVESKFNYVIGCASIHLNGRDNVTAIFNEVATKHLAPPAYRVYPRVAYPMDKPTANATTIPRIPPLLKGYTRMGAWVCGEPAWDADFNTADMFVLLPLARLSKAYARHFFGHAMAA